MKIKIITALLLTLAISAGLLAGCGKDETEETQTQPQAANAGNPDNSSANDETEPPNAHDDSSVTSGEAGFKKDFTEISAFDFSELTTNGTPIALNDSLTYKRINSLNESDYYIFYTTVSDVTHGDQQATQGPVDTLVAEEGGKIVSHGEIFGGYRLVYGDNNQGKFIEYTPDSMEGTRYDGYSYSWQSNVGAFQLLVSNGDERGIFPLLENDGYSHNVTIGGKDYTYEYFLEEISDTDKPVGVLIDAGGDICFIQYSWGYDVSSWWEEDAPDIYYTGTTFHYVHAMTSDVPAGIFTHPEGYEVTDYDW